jgi:cytochrome c-type biogenesis protein CcmH
VADDPAVWCEYADAVGMAQGGHLAGKPAGLIARAQALNPRHPCVLEMAGSLAYGRAEYASASRHWRQLLEQVRDDEAARGELLAAIARADRLAR